jgi:hypothetical protein
MNCDQLKKCIDGVVKSCVVYEIVKNCGGGVKDLKKGNGMLGFEDDDYYYHYY